MAMLFKQRLEVTLRFVEFLLERGADVNAQGGQYGNALYSAAVDGHSEVVDILLKRGADVNTQGGVHGNALRGATAYGHVRVVEVLLNYGVHLNTQEDSGLTPLHTAVNGGNVAMVRFLLEQGASPDLEDLGGNTPLQLAIRNQDHEIVLLLYPKTAVDLSSITASELRRCSDTANHCHLEMIGGDSPQVAFKDDSLFKELKEASYPLSFEHTELSVDGKNFMNRHFDAKRML